MRPWQHGATLHKHICNTTTHAHKNHKHASKRKNRHTDGRFSQGWWVLFLIKMGGERKVWSFDVATHSPSVSLNETLKPFVFMQFMLIIKQTFCFVKYLRHVRTRRSKRKNGPRTKNASGCSRDRQTRKHAGGCTGCDVVEITLTSRKPGA